MSPGRSVSRFSMNTWRNNCFLGAMRLAEAAPRQFEGLGHHRRTRAECAARMSYDGPPKGELFLPYQQVIFGVFLFDLRSPHRGRTDGTAARGARRREATRRPTSRRTRGGVGNPAEARFRPGCSRCSAPWRCC